MYVSYNLKHGIFGAPASGVAVVYDLQTRLPSSRPCAVATMRCFGCLNKVYKVYIKLALQRAKIVSSI